MEKIMNELVELANEGKKEMLVSYKKDMKDITINNTCDRILIDDKFIIGTIDLETYNTYEDIKEELEYMIENN